jgi:formylglycine-generating enzyme
MAARSRTLAGIALLASGCVLPTFNTDENLRDSGVAYGGSAGAAGQDAGAEASAGSAGSTQKCPDDGDGLPMVRLPANFCIDATEVTQEQYLGFVEDTKVDPTQESAQPQALCSANASFKPSCHWNDGPLEPTMPVVCVSWCDAWAYCNWNGKRLCGRLGGGTLLPEDSGQPNISEWTYACSSGGTSAYPYGPDYVQTKCNTETQSMVPAGSKPDCQSTSSVYAGAYDLSGNVWEWEDSCSGIGDASDLDMCNLRGGGFKNSGGDTSVYSCFTYTIGAERHTDWEDIGFRCCADLE